MLAPPLRDRFGIINRLEMYTSEELQEIVTRSAKALDIAIDEQGAAEIARRSRGTPRIANRLLKRVRDFSAVKGSAEITREDADFALSRLEIDKLGLDQTDRNLLTALIEKFNGGPAGLETLAAAAKSRGCEVALYGHTHTPLVSQIDGGIVYPIQNTSVF